MKYKIDFNKKLGKLPVSLFVDIDKIKIFDVWDSIIEYDCRDIIFSGDIINNMKELGFLLGRLAINAYHTSIIITELNDTSILELQPHRFIIFFDSNVQNSTHFKARIELFKKLTNNDVIILHPKSLKEFIFTRQELIRQQVKAKVMVKLLNISEEDVLKNKIYDVDIYNGEFYV